MSKYTYRPGSQWRTDYNGGCSVYNARTGAVETYALEAPIGSNENGERVDVYKEINKIIAKNAADNGTYIMADMIKSGSLTKKAFAKASKSYSAQKGQKKVESVLEKIKKVAKKVGSSAKKTAGKAVNTAKKAAGNVSSKVKKLFK